MSKSYNFGIVVSQVSTHLNSALGRLWTESESIMGVRLRQLGFAPNGRAGSWFLLLPPHLSDLLGGPKPAIGLAWLTFSYSPRPARWTSQADQAGSLGPALAGPAPNTSLLSTVPRPTQPPTLHFLARPSLLLASPSWPGHGHPELPPQIVPWSTAQTGPCAGAK